MSVVRWRLEEMATGETYTVEFNPNTATTHRGPRNIEFTPGLDGVPRGIKTPSEPTPWTRGGVVMTKAHHDALERWGKKKGKVRVSDHAGRTFEVMMKGARITDRRQTASNPWRFTYEMDCLILRRVA